VVKHLSGRAAWLLDSGVADPYRPAANRGS
jgi:hypothetical protein